MEIVFLLLGFAFAFPFGYFFGYRDQKFEKLIGSLVEFKESLVEKFTRRQKVVILNNKDEPIEEEES